MDDPRRYAPAAARNRADISDALRDVLPRHGRVLEVASGTGEHVAHLAAAMPGLIFQPTERDKAAHASIDAWCAALPNVRPALTLDVEAVAWPVDAAAVVLCINMLHIAPWRATLGLLRGAAAVLDDGGVLVLYGPFRRGGAHTAPSNAAFDAALRAQCPAWGVRDLDDVAAAATGFAAPAVTTMPVNNLLVVLRRVRCGPAASG